MRLHEETLYQTIGTRIKEHRQALKLTQKQLAELLGVERTSVTNIESGSQRPPLHLLYLACHVLKVDLSEMLPPITDVVQTDIEEVVVDGETAKLPPKTAELVRELLRNLEQK